MLFRSQNIFKRTFARVKANRNSRVNAKKKPTKSNQIQRKRTINNVPKSGSNNKRAISKVKPSNLNLKKAVKSKK